MILEEHDHSGTELKREVNPVSDLEMN
jgi:hypothetical protein